MITIIRVATAAVAGIAISCAAVRLGAEDRAAGLKELADAERAFAKLSVAKGVAQSFHENFADDGIGFNPQPVKVKADMAKRPPLDTTKPRAILDWYPVLSDLAASGEMGFNLGPSLVTPPPGDTAKPRHGYFFSVWKRQADGKFKVVLDIGSDTSGPVAGDSPEAWRAVRIEQWIVAAGDISIEKETTALRDQEAALTEAIAKRGAADAYAEVLASDFRVFENTFAPAMDRAGVKAHFTEIGARANRTFTPQHAEVARSADVGYSWGSYTALAEKGHYAHYWRKNAKGEWRLVVEIIRPDAAR